MDKSLPFFSLLFIFAMWEACAASVPTKSLFYGFDFGTSGVRCCLIDSARGIIHEDSILWTNIRPANSLISMTDSWETATDLLLESTPIAFRGDVKRICISGTSSSALVYDLKHGIVSRQPRMYDFNVLQESGASNFGSRAMTAIQSVCPTGSAANAPTSSLAKVLSWNFESPFLSSERLLHQSDFLIHHITSSSIATMGKYESDPKAGVVFSSDWHNSLKLGYDVHSLSYPEWMLNLLFEEGILASFLPAVVEPGRSITIVNDRLVDMGYSKDCSVVAGKFTVTIARYSCTNISKRKFEHSYSLFSIILS